MGSCMGKRRINPENVIVNRESRTKLKYTSMNSIYEEYDYLIELDKFLHDKISKEIGWKYTLERHLNRYPTILPYDYNRVRLINMIDECDYVNASWITGPLDLEENLESTKHNISLQGPSFISFIASQAPTENTCVHHLQMILDYSIDIVVVLTPIYIDNCEDERCHQYWPTEEGESKSFDHISITKLSEEQLRKDTFQRKLVISANKHEGIVEKDSKSTRHQFTQFHYIGWPDCSIPSDSKHQIHEKDPIVSLLDDVKKEINTETEKKEIRILVHCSVGVGRTGTFIAVFQLNEAMQKLKRLQYPNSCNFTCANSSVHDEIIPGLIDKRRENLKISRGLDIFEVVLSLRCKRMNMVEAPEQYAYLYLYAEMETEREFIFRYSNKMDEDSKYSR